MVIADERGGGNWGAEEGGGGSRLGLGGRVL